MKVAVTGGSGSLGAALVAALRSDGHEVLLLVRRRSAAPDQIEWHPDTGQVDLDRLAGTEGVVNLAGAGLGDRPWTPAYRRTVLESRTSSTNTIATAMAALDPKPRVLLSQAAIGYYGASGDAVVDEDAPAGRTYLAEIVSAWEQATAPAAVAGIRVVTMRTGLVVTGKGGAFGGRLIPIFKLGLGGRIGWTGSQWWSWVTLTDWVRAVRFLLARDDISGPVNISAPEPLTNADITTTMGRVLHRPTVFRVPGFALKLPLRDFAEDMLAGQRVSPRKLLEAGFVFDQPTFEAGLRHELAVANAQDATS
jgi:uncharacterized protein (TIGR01777 family)